MSSLFNKKNNMIEPVQFEHDKENGVVRFEHDGQTEGKGNIALLESFAEVNNFPIFKDTIDNAYESDFLEYKDKCPLCNTPTVQQYSSFIWANQVASRILAAPAGHFCPNCPTVIIDDDIMKSGVNKARFEYWGTCAIDTGYHDTNLFKTFNGIKPTYILDENGGLDGILNSVHTPSGQRYSSPNQPVISFGQSPLQAKNKKVKNKNKNKQARQSRKANRKK
jgi:hypothetical protein